MRTAHSVDFFRDIALFQDLQEDQLQKLAQISSFEKFSKFQYIYSNGSKSDKLYFLKKGVVKIGNTADDGREVIKAMIHPKSLFGELSLMGQERRNNFARAMNSEVECVCFYIRDLEQFMIDHPVIQTRILRFVGQRLMHMERKVESLVLQDARTRIIEFIKDNAIKRGRKVGFETLFKHCLTQQDIANITGTSRQTVTSVLNDLKKSNQIYFNRRSILVRDLEKFG